MTVMRFPLNDDARSLASDPAAAPAFPPARDQIPLGDVLAERRRTHGDFASNARVAQNLKRVMDREDGWSRLTDDQRETLDMIAHKIGRILAGNPNFPDHWTDIAGYASRSAERLQGNPAKTPKN